MLFCLIACFAAVSSGPAKQSAVAPTIEASGRDIVIRAGEQGHIYLVEEDLKGPAKEIQVGKFVTAVDTLRASVGKLFVTLGNVQKTCLSVQQNVTNLGKTLTFVHSLLSENLQSLQAKIVNEASLRKDSADEAMFAVQELKTELRASIESNKEETEDAIDNIAEGIEAIDVNLASLGNIVDNVTNIQNANASKSVATCNALIIKNGSTSPLAATKHVIGTRVTVFCNAGFYLGTPSARVVLCGPAGNYCSTSLEHSGEDDHELEEQASCFDLATDNLQDVCKPCAAGCSACTAQGSLCTACQDPDALLVGSVDATEESNGGLCVSKNATQSSCKELQKAGVLGHKAGSFDVKLVSPRKHTLVKATCLVLASGEIHTMIKCNDLQGKYSCISPSKVEDKNTCTEFGYAHAPFRNELHYLASYRAFGSKTLWRFMRTVGGVSKNADGGTYKNCVMRSGDADATCSDWASVDGQDWWLADTVREGQWNDGDYTAGCYIGIKRGNGPAGNHLGTFDFAPKASGQHDCTYTPGSFYFCSSADY